MNIETGAYEITMKSNIKKTRNSVDSQTRDDLQRYATM